MKAVLVRGYVPPPCQPRQKIGTCVSVSFFLTNYRCQNIGSFPTKNRFVCSGLIKTCLLKQKTLLHGVFFLQPVSQWFSALWEKSHETVVPSSKPCKEIISTSCNSCCNYFSQLFCSISCEASCAKIARCNRTLTLSQTNTNSNMRALPTSIAEQSEPITCPVRLKTNILEIKGILLYSSHSAAMETITPIIATPRNSTSTSAYVIKFRTNTFIIAKS